MNMFLENSLFAGAAISLGSYAIGLWLRKKSGSSLCNPLLVSIVLTISFLLLTGTSYESYQQSTQIISYMLTPATVCLALPLYEQFEPLKKNVRAILVAGRTCRHIVRSGGKPCVHIAHGPGFRSHA